MNSGLSWVFRLLLLFVSLATSAFFLSKIRKAKAYINDVIFWMSFSMILVILSIFPRVLTVFSTLLGIQSPTNFLFLVVIFLLLVHQFSLTIRVSALEEKTNKLGRCYALEKEKEEQK